MKGCLDFRQQITEVCVIFIIVAVLGKLGIVHAPESKSVKLGHEMDFSSEDITLQRQGQAACEI